MFEWVNTGCVPDSEKTRRHRINVFGVEFVKFSSTVDQDGALERLFGKMVVSNTIMRKIVEHFERQEVAGGGDVAIPIENRAVYYLNMFSMTTR